MDKLAVCQGVQPVQEKESDGDPLQTTFIVEMASD